MIQMNISDALTRTDALLAKCVRISFVVKPSACCKTFLMVSLPQIRKVHGG